MPDYCCDEPVLVCIMCDDEHKCEAATLRAIEKAARALRVIAYSWHPNETVLDAVTISQEDWDTLRQALDAKTEALDA
jgi:hypothetical protein